jgi:hypothetical protein
MNKKTYKKNIERRCPKCNGKNGIYGVFVDEKIKKEKFLYCNSCHYDILNGIKKEKNK